MSAILVAAGAAACVAAIAHVATLQTSPLAAGANLGGVADLPESVASATIHPKIADDGFNVPTQSAVQQAPRETETRKPAKRHEIEGWIKEAIKILQANGTPIDEDSVDEIYTVIIKESSGNPNAVNNWDSNAARGTPSKGLMQCIEPTFKAYKLPGHNNILDPVDSIIAGVRYTYARYGGFRNHPGLVSIRLGGRYRGY